MEAILRERCLKHRDLVISMALESSIRCGKCGVADPGSSPRNDRRQAGTMHHSTPAISHAVRSPSHAVLARRTLGTTAMCWPSRNARYEGRCAQTRRTERFESCVVLALSYVHEAVAQISRMIRLRHFHAKNRTIRLQRLMVDDLSVVVKAVLIWSDTFGVFRRLVKTLLLPTWVPSFWHIKPQNVHMQQIDHMCGHSVVL